MATEAQIAANRLNAQKSTGPRTAEGKERAAQNALTHGLFAREGVIRGEDEDQFEEHRERLLGQLCPAGPLEEILAARIVELSWRLRRAVQDQSGAFVAMYDRQAAAGSDGGTGILPVDVNHGQDAHATAATVGRMILEDFGRSAVLERLLRYERRIESSLYRTLNELRRVHDQALKADREDINTLERWREEDWNARKARFAFTPPAEVSPGPAGQTRKIGLGSLEPPAGVARGAGIASASLSGQALLVAGDHGQELAPAQAGDAHATETAAGVTHHSHIPSFHHSSPRPDAREDEMCETNPISPGVEFQGSGVSGLTSEPLCQTKPIGPGIGWQGSGAREPPPASRP